MEQYIMYLRKSQMDRDFDDVSIAETLKRHKKILSDYALYRKLNVTVILEEVVSGESLSGRPEMMKCLELINTGDYAGVLCMDIDRLSRGSSVDSGYIMQVLQVNQCKIITPQKTYDLLDESDEQFTDMKFMFSRYELKTINKRLVRGRKQSTAEGKYVMSIPPYGYEKYKLPGTKGNSLRIIPEQAKVVQMIFDMYTERGIGYNTIVYELNRLHIPPARGEKWMQSSIRNIITNETYTGKTIWGASTMKKVIQHGELKKKRVMNKEYNIFEGMHEAIISPEQFEKSVRIRNSKFHPSTSLDKQLQNPFAGLMYCHKCGGTIKRNVSDHNTLPWYRCPTKGCKCSVVKCHIVEQTIVEQMTSWLQDYMIKVEDNEPQDDTQLSDALSLVQKQLADMTEQQNRICELLEQGVYSIQLFQKRNSTLEDDIRKLRRAEADLLKQQNAMERSAQNNIIPTVQKLLDSYDQLDPQSKNDLWKEVVEKITFVRERGAKDFEVHIYPKIPH